MAPFVQQMKSLFKRGIAFILNIGADPEDSEYIRLIKRIWYVSSVVALPTSLIVGLNEFMAGNKLMAAGFFFSFVIFLGFLVDGAPAESSWSGCSVPSMPSSSQKNGGRFTFFVCMPLRSWG
ncbi:MAG: hypothetical protein A2V45_02805 [Candidatus Aminicenantes bacterium RBG_19FT_COMBO_58_17]|nr:MAG: hypothetical protein A2V45_02805 [Candidatus Aminicenantes bacterium RBG_19FT_COMBO_58_17]